jgi:hypothetical protein
MKFKKHLFYSGLVAKSVKILLIQSFLCICLGVHHMVLANEITGVEISDHEGRKEAVVSLKAIRDQKKKADETGNVVKETITKVEDGTFEVMGASSDYVGRGTDGTIKAIQSFGESMFSWFFKLTDQFQNGDSPKTRIKNFDQASE